MKNSKGITLIALIITIIVMLLLVGVTINVAINGGIFEKAKKAAKLTERQIIYDEIVTSMVLTNSGTINVAETATDAKNLLEAEGKSVLKIGDSLSILIIDDEYPYLITCSRIIMLSESDFGDGENFEVLTKLTWKDIGINNVKLGTNYVGEDNYIFNEDENGINMTIAGIELNNTTILGLCLGDLITPNGDNRIDLEEEELGISRIDFNGNTVVVTYSDGVATDTATIQN
ncbi:MAG: hypothetical protein J5507_06410 [Clostridia bacterium]|nr:hypothetical protein [Clostridia bacterium]